MLIYRFNAILIKIPADTLGETDKLNVKFVMEIPMDLEQQKSFLKRVKVEKTI